MMERPRPASLFQRDRTLPPPVIRGVEQLAGNPALEFPLAGRIVALEFVTALSSPRGVATLRLEFIPQAAAHLRVHFQFANVRELSLASLPAEGLDCAGFGIEDARGLNRPQVNWELGDFRAGQIHAFAEEAEVVSVVMAA